MQRRYDVIKMEGGRLENCGLAHADQLESARIENYPWGGIYQPEAGAWVFYDDLSLHVLLRAYEEKIKAVYKNKNDPVYRDSCLEFFVNPFPEAGEEYFNFEWNPLGNLLLGYGKDRMQRKPVDEKLFELFQVRTSVSKENLADYHGAYWQVGFSIPFAFLRGYCGRKGEFSKGKRILGNFYKCGDETDIPHYGCWNEISSSVPDFHRPECFGELVFI